MADRPNVLLFLTDQQRHDTIHSLGNPVIRTPAHDRLVREGTAFTSAYTTSPVCVSARCSLYWGQYPQHTGCYENSYPMCHDRPNLFGMLTDAGYRTHGVGKCHFNPNPNAMYGFQTRDHQEELRGKREDDDYCMFLVENGYGYVCDPHGVRGEMYYHPQPSPMPPHLHPTHWVGDKVCDFIEGQAQGSSGGSDEPWMCMSSFIHPHPPFSPPHPWHKLYRAPLMPLPKLPADSESLHQWVNKFQNRYKYRDQGFDLNLVRALKAYYYACVSFIDQQMGRIINTLERTGQLDNTLIIHTSDHGELLGDYRCFGKRSMHDSASRVPMLVRYPERFKAGTVCDQPVSHVDVAQTIMAATGTTPQAKLDGLDLAEIAAGNCDRPFVTVQHQQGAGGAYAMVSRDWKYVYSAPDQREMLFNRVTDPLETRDQAGQPLTRDALTQHRTTLIDWLHTMGEEQAIDGNQWKVYPKNEMPVNPDHGLLIQDAGWADTSIPGYTD